MMATSAIKLSSSREIVKQLTLRINFLRSRVDKLHNLSSVQRRKIRALEFNEKQAIEIIRTLKDQVEKLSLEKDKIARKRLKGMRT